MCLLKNTIIASAAATAAAEWAPVCLPSLADGGFSIQFNIIWLFSPLKGSVNWAIKRRKKKASIFFFSLSFLQTGGKWIYLLCYVEIYLV